MCNQAVCLIAAELERRGITTVCIVLLRKVAEKMRPPRALAVPFRHGFALGAPHDQELQRRVLEAPLALLDRNDVPLVAGMEVGSGLLDSLRANELRLHSESTG